MRTCSLKDNLLAMYSNCTVQLQRINQNASSLLVLIDWFDIPYIQISIFIKENIMNRNKVHCTKYTLYRMSKKSCPIFFIYPTRYIQIHFWDPRNQEKWRKSSFHRIQSILQIYLNRFSCANFTIRRTRMNMGRRSTIITILLKKKKKKYIQTAENCPILTTYML